MVESVPMISATGLMTVVLDGLVQMWLDQETGIDDFLNNNGF